MPGTSALVESASSRSTPSAPSRAKPPRSVSLPSSGSWSILKSPVCSTSPALVLIATASASGIEWFTARNSSDHGPNSRLSPAATSTVSGTILCSVSLLLTSASVRREPTSGMSARWRSRYGTAPMWSSCACVRTSASIRSSLPSRAEKSGRIRSTPGWSCSGNSTPQSTTSRRPACSKTVMFRPISPSPPSATIRMPPAGQRRRRPQLWVRMAHLSFTPPAVRSSLQLLDLGRGRVRQRQPDRAARAVRAGRARPWS